MPRGLSERAHNKVLEAATELFAERGIDATSVDAIAAASGVSKATIYKHWVDKDALCLGVMEYVHNLDAGPPEVNSGDLKADLKAFLKYEPSNKKAAVLQKLTPHLIAYSARNVDFARAWKTRVMDRARTQLKNLMRRGVGEGIFPATIDEDLGVALLLGPMMYRHIFGSSVSLEWLAAGTVDAFWRAHARREVEKASAPKVKGRSGNRLR